MHAVPAPDHVTRTEYVGPSAPLRDAVRCQLDLLDAITNRGTLVAEVDQIEFLARRAHALTQRAWEYVHARWVEENDLEAHR